jgi:L-methionine (R)-S-oxide reductase
MLLRPNDQQGPCTTVADVAKRLATTESVDDIVAVLRAHTRTIIGSDGVAVILREGERCHYVAEDAVEPLWLGQRYPLTACVSGWAMLNDQTAVVPDVGLDPRVPVSPYQSKSICSLVMAPIGSPVPVAALGAYWCAYVLIGAETVARVEDLARQAGDALARILRSTGGRQGV